MTLSRRNYRALDAVWLIFEVSPVCASLHLLLSILHALLPTAVTAVATARFVDTAAAVLQGKQPQGDIYMPLALLLAVLGMFTTIHAFVQLVSSRISLDLQRKLKPAVTLKHAALDFRHIENAASWELISRVSRDPAASLVEGFAAHMQFMQVVLCVASVLVLIVTQVWWAALIILVFSTPMFLLSIRAGKKNYQAARDIEKFNRRSEYLDEVLTGRDAVDERTLFGYGEEISRRWREQYEAGRVFQLKVSARMFLITKGSSVMLALIALLVALTLIGPVTTGHLSAGMFMGIVSAVFSMIQQLGWQMSFSLENISRVGEYMKDLSAFLALSEAEDALCEPAVKAPELEKLEFRGVRFKYPGGERYVLDGLSFTLAGGLHYAFVGRNGAGKTTITKLLTGLYSEYEGEILINGRDLRQYTAGELKALFSVVYQDFAKYSISLEDNIALGDISGVDTASRIPESVRQAGLQETLQGLKTGLKTPLGKILGGGQDISGGQWQRVAIARSLISRAPVKILDEPTAALDPVSESRVYGEFEKLMKGKTTIFISHRLGSTKLADEILVIDGGQVRERGSHDELLKINGQYAGMFETQRGWYL